MKRLLRYAAVGAAATAAHWALLALAVEAWHWRPWLGSGAGALLGAQVAFWGNRRYTFQHRGAWRPAWVRFHVTAGAGALLGMGLVAMGVWAGLHYLLAQAVATTLVMLATFAANRAWAFNLDPAVGRVRGPDEADCWQGAPTKWARAHKEKQRRQRPEATGQRACSAAHQSGDVSSIDKRLMRRDLR